MDLGRRRLWLALASASAFLVHRLMVELALGRGGASQGLADAQPFVRVVIAVVALGIAALVARDIRRGRQDWPVERLVAVLASLGIAVELLRALTGGIAFAPTLALLDVLARWTALLVGTAIWLPGKRP